MYFIGISIPHSSSLLTIPVAFIYKSPLISNRDTIICDKREFILWGFTFSAICDTLYKNKSKGIIL